MTPLQRHILHTLAPALDADILRDSLTEWLSADTLARFHSHGVSFRPMLSELVEFLSDYALAAFVEHLKTEADLDDLPPAPAIVPADWDTDLLEMPIKKGVAW